MSRQYNNTPSQDSEEFLDSSLQSPQDLPPVSRRRLRVPLWKRLRGVCFLLVFLGVVELGAATLTASHFDVKAVQVEGLADTSAAPVQEIAQKMVGQNWFRVNSDKAVQSIKQIPTVSTVRVHRLVTWPPQLEVIVEERQPYVNIGDGVHWWKVDANGVPYEMEKQPNASNLEALTGPKFHPQLGKPLPSEQWQKITHLLQSMQADQQQTQDGFRWDLRRIYFDRSGNVSLRLKDALHKELLVQLGNDLWPAKLKRARVALAYLDKTGQRAKVLNFVSYKIPTWIPMPSNT